MYYDTQITSVNTGNPSPVQIYAHSGPSPEAPLTLLNQNLEAKRVFIRFFRPLFLVCAPGSRASRAQIRRCSQVKAICA